MSGERRLVWAGAVGLLLFAGAIASDFLVGSFWQRHSLLTSLLANVLVVAITVVVLNELLERRDRKRWNLLAQNALFVLTQSARATWTEMIELLGITEVHAGMWICCARMRCLPPIRPAFPPPRTDSSARTTAGTPAESQPGPQRALRGGDRQLGAGPGRRRPYAEILDRHVELAGRLEWLSSVLCSERAGAPMRAGAGDPSLAAASPRSTQLPWAAISGWRHGRLRVKLATRLDEQSHEMAFSIVSQEWWAERTD